MSFVKSSSKKVILLVLDGLGIADANKGNAVKLAKTPNLTKLWNDHPHAQLQASGNFVGLPEGIMGNSEVGHMSLGAGKIIFQEIARIDNSIKDKSFFDNKVFKEAVKHVKKNKSKLHLIGLVSHGRVHSSIDHLFACLEFAKKEDLKKDQVLVHAFTDGRDSPPQSASTFFTFLDEKFKKVEVGRLASIIGRYYSMDRDDRWVRTKLAYDLLTGAKGVKVKNWKEGIEKSYAAGVNDEYIKPMVIVKEDDPSQPMGVISDNDAVIFFNYRADRALQLSQAFEKDNFKGWQRNKLKNLFFVGFSNYEKGIPITRSAEDVAVPGGESQFVKENFAQELRKTAEGFPKNQIFPPEIIDKSLGQVIADSGLSQLRISESEKFPHVTYFFSARNYDPFKNEIRIEIPSPTNVATYDLKPEMSTYEITERTVKEIDKEKFDFILVNFALTDMVAHTGSLKASIKAVEVADICMDNLVKGALAKDYNVLITADHGNIEELINLRTNEVDTQHSTNPVPFIFVNNNTSTETVKDLPPGMLVDLSPTVLDLMGIRLPDEMTGRSLLD